MCAFTSDFDRARAGYSPDRMDALVWALTELTVSNSGADAWIKWAADEAMRSLGMSPIAAHMPNNRPRPGEPAQPDGGDVMAQYLAVKMQLAGAASGARTMTRVKIPEGSSHWYLITGRQVAIPPDRIIEVTEEELESVLQNGGKRLDR
jgi:hypothetical protein